MMRRGIGRVGRPGLVGTVARTAVIAGTASAVAGGVSHKQQQKYAAQSQQAAAAQAPPPPPAEAPPPPPAAPAGDMDDVIAQLQKLGELKEQGILTEEEFEAQKAKLLG